MREVKRADRFARPHRECYTKSFQNRVRVVNWRIGESRCADILELDLSSQANR